MIATVTLNPAIDHTVRLDEPLEGGAVQRTREARFDAGGKGINVSKYLGGLGIETLATGVSGGFLGEFVAERLESEGIAHEFVSIDDHVRLNTTILADGEYKINHAGPNLDVATVGEIIAVLDTHDPDRVVVAGSLPPGLGPESIDRIARGGAWGTVVDLGGELLCELNAEYALCAPNQAELTATTGTDTGTIEECRAATLALRESGFERVLTSLGADGALLAAGGETYHASALDTEVVDTVGAGDSLLAGVLAAREREASDERALAAGIAVASRAVSVPGTTIPLLGDVKDDAEKVSVSVV
ncbi:1-phosphofructokinase [Halobacteriales archaeon QS_3_64_16]|nr:MAG: 1-phosphofructokinase [Halobacteriales archaeon QS_3_64_16]